MAHVNFINANAIVMMVIFFLQHSEPKLVNLHQTFKVNPHGYLKVLIADENYSFTIDKKEIKKYSDGTEYNGNLSLLWLKLLKFYSFDFFYRNFKVSISCQNPLLKKTSEKTLVIHHPFTKNDNYLELSRIETDYLFSQIVGGFSYFGVPRLASNKRPLFSKIYSNCRYDEKLVDNDLFEVYDRLEKHDSSRTANKENQMDIQLTNGSQGPFDDLPNENFHILPEQCDINLQISVITNSIYSYQYDLISLSKEMNDSSEEEKQDKDASKQIFIKPASIIRTVIKFVFASYFEENKVDDLVSKYLESNYMKNAIHLQEWLDSEINIDAFVNSVQKFVRKFVSFMTNDYIIKGNFIIKSSRICTILHETLTSSFEGSDSSGSLNTSLNETVESVRVEENNLDREAIEKVIDRIYCEELCEEGIMEKLLRFKSYLRNAKAFQRQNTKLRNNQVYSWIQAIHDFSQDFDIIEDEKPGYYNKKTIKCLDSGIQLNHEFSTEGCMQSSGKLEANLLGLFYPSKPSTMLARLDKMPQVCPDCFMPGHLKVDCTGCPKTTISMKRWKLEEVKVKSLDIHRHSLMTEAMQEFSSIVTNNSQLEKKMNCFNLVKNHLESQLPTVSIELFGSCANGLASFTSDIDACITEKSFGTGLTFDREASLKKFMFKIRSILDLKFRSQGLVFSSVIICKVPIVSFVFQDGTQGDLSFSNALAIHNTKMLKTYTEISPRFLTLAICLKHILKFTKIGSAKDGHISSYGYIIMLIYYLQKVDVLPYLQEIYNGSKKPVEKIDGWNVWYQSDKNIINSNWTSQNQMSIAELWFGFLKFYLFQFDRDNLIVNIRTSRDITKISKLWNAHFSIEDPFDLDHELTRHLKRQNFNNVLHTFYLVLINMTSSINKGNSNPHWKFHLFFDKNMIIKSHQKDSGSNNKQRYMKMLDNHNKSYHKLLFNHLTGQAKQQPIQKNGPNPVMPLHNFPVALGMPHQIRGRFLPFVPLINFPVNLPPFTPIIRLPLPLGSFQQPIQNFSLVNHNQAIKISPGVKENSRSTSVASTSSSRKEKNQKKTSHIRNTNNSHENKKNNNN